MKGATLKTLAGGEINNTRRSRWLMANERREFHPIMGVGGVRTLAKLGLARQERRVVP